MSASREKKQRQGAGPSVRDTQAQQKEAEYKRKARIYTVIGVVAVILVAALLIWNSGVFQKGQTAAVVGNTKYSISDVSYFYQQAKYQSNYIYYAYGMSQYIPADTDVQDEATGKTWRDYYLEQALENMKQITALYDEAIQNGRSDKDVEDDISKEIEDTKSAADSNGLSYKAYLKAMYGSYMSAGSFKSIATRRAVASAWYSDHADSLTYSDAEIDAYYTENIETMERADVRHILIKAETATDDEGNTVAPTEEAWAAARTKAQQVLDEFKAGAQTEDAFTELTKKYSEDVDADGNPNNDGLYANISRNDGYVTEFLDWIFQDGGHKAGDTGIVEHDGGASGYSGCHIMYYVKNNASDHSELVSDTLRSEDTSKWLEDLAGTYSASLESGAKYVAQ